MAKYHSNSIAAHPACAADNYHLDAFILQATAAGRFLTLCQRLKTAQGIVFLMSGVAFHCSPELRQPPVQLYHLYSKRVLLMLSRSKVIEAGSLHLSAGTIGMLSFLSHSASIISTSVRMQQNTLSGGFQTSQAPSA